MNGHDAPGATEDLHEMSADDAELPSVDSLESQLTGVEDAMDLLQKGDADAAEAAIESLENPVEATTGESE